MSRETEGRASGCHLEELTEDGAPPDLRQVVPAITDQNAGVDQDDAREGVRVLRSPGKPEGTAEVVQHEADFLDAKVDQGACEKASVARDGVVEVRPLAGTSESWHVERHGSAKLTDAPHEIFPIAAGSHRVSYHKQSETTPLRRPPDR